MSSQSRSTVGLFDLAAKLPSMITEVPILARGAAGLVRKPSSKESIGLIFQNVARAHPDRPFVRFEGRAVSYRDANERVNRFADVLRGRGVERGDVVAVLAKNTPDALLVALAVVKLGAAAGMLNYNQRDDVLAHSLTLLDARVLVVADECHDALKSLPAGFTGPDRILVSELDELARAADSTDPAVTAQVLAKERAFFIFTSGTTGMPKASLMTHFRWLKSMSGLGMMGVRLRGSDTLYCCLPLYHNNALTVSLSSVLASGASLAIGRQFSASRFWDDVALNHATAFAYIGELCRYLLNQPAKATDRDNAVRLMVGNGLRPEIWAEFTERFGISRVAEFYGASECNIAFVNALNLDKTAGICPLPHAVVEYDEDTGKAVRGSDGKLRRVRTGDVGLLLSKVTDRAPFDGYTDEEASNSKLLHGGFKKDDTWFDTGDLVRKQGWGHVAFVDRLGDTFRWKGENVATTEVEGAVSSHPAFAEAVVYGVEVPGADGRAGMAAVTLRENEKFDGNDIATHLYGKLPGYAIPLFIRIVDSLEYTTTFKSRKVELRGDGYEVGSDRLYVLEGRSGGYVEMYDDYVDGVAAGSVPKG